MSASKKLQRRHPVIITSPMGDQGVACFPVGVQSALKTLQKTKALLEELRVGEERFKFNLLVKVMADSSHPGSMRGAGHPSSR